MGTLETHTLSCLKVLLPRLARHLILCLPLGEKRPHREHLLQQASRHPDAIQDVPQRDATGCAALDSPAVIVHEPGVPPENEDISAVLPAGLGVKDSGVMARLLRRLPLGMEIFRRKRHHVHSTGVSRDDVPEQLLLLLLSSRWLERSVGMGGKCTAGLSVGSSIVCGIRRGTPRTCCCHAQLIGCSNHAWGTPKWRLCVPSRAAERPRGRCERGKGANAYAVSFLQSSTQSTHGKLVWCGSIGASLTALRVLPDAGTSAECRS